MIPLDDRIPCYCSWRTVWWCTIYKTRLSLKTRFRPTKVKSKCWRLMDLLSWEITILMNLQSKEGRMSLSSATLLETHNSISFTRELLVLTYRQCQSLFYSELTVRINIALKLFMSSQSRQSQRNCKKMEAMEVPMMILMMTYCKFLLQKMTLRAPPFWFLIKILSYRNLSLS